jgi:glycosyltransferase involved in cell wall biosynthesis
MYHDYREGANGLKRLAISLLAHRLRQWDIESSARVDHFAANSQNVAQRVWKYYRRDATVIYPPVDTTYFQPASNEPDDFYLYVGQLTRYKRVDIAIEAFNRLGKALVVIGDGEERSHLQRLAGPTIRFLGRADNTALREHYTHCRALIFPGEEDFGIVPLEVMASGRPVLAYGRGGALETVVPGRTGLLFDEQTPEALINAVERFESFEPEFEPAAIAAHASRFSKALFQQNFRDFIDNALAEAGAARGQLSEPLAEAFHRHDGWRPRLAHG